MITDKETIEKITSFCLFSAYEHGHIHTNVEGELTYDQVFPFDIDEMAGIHTHCQGIGDGVYFRLKNNDVYDIYGGLISSNKVTRIFDSV